MQFNFFPLLRIGQKVHFELVHVLFLGVGRVVREEDLTGVSPWGMGILVNEKLALGRRKLSVVS